MKSLFALLYGTLAYFVFFGTILYAIGFITGIGVPKTIDDGPDTPVLAAIMINVALMSVFAVQHSVMARPAFKRWWTKIVSPTIERSTFALLEVSRSFCCSGNGGLFPRRSGKLPTHGRGAHGAVAGRLGAGVRQHLHDQPFRAVRPAPSH